jgi:hypothetical protein
LIPARHGYHHHSTTQCDDTAFSQKPELEGSTAPSQPSLAFELTHCTVADQITTQNKSSSFITLQRRVGSLHSRVRSPGPSVTAHRGTAVVMSSKALRTLGLQEASPGTPVGGRARRTLSEAEANRPPDRVGGKLRRHLRRPSDSLHGQPPAAKLPPALRKFRAMSTGRR